MQGVVNYGYGNAVTQRTEFTSKLLEDFLAYLDAGSKKTEETYTRSLRLFFTWTNLHNISAPTLKDLIAFKEELKATSHKATTINSYVGALRIFFKWTEENNLYRNIAKSLKREKVSRDLKKDYLTTSQVREVLSSAHKEKGVQGLRDYAILSLMVTCGLRTIEVVRANIEDLRTLGDDCVLFVQGKGKTEKADYVKVQAPVEKAIREYLKARGKTQESAPLFASLSNNSKPHGSRMTTRSVSGIAKASMREAGFDSSRLTAHSLRHTACTLALHLGMPVEQVQQFARHANITTTMNYVHLLDKAQNKCSATLSSAIFQES